MGRHGWMATAIAVAAVAAACGSRGGSGSMTAEPNGTGSVFGSVLDNDFTYSPSKVAVFAAPIAGMTNVNVYLCEAGCDPASLNLAPETRALVLTLSVTDPAPIGGASFTIGTRARALAVWRRSADVAATLGQPQTQYALASSGTVALSSAEFAPGGRVAGQFDLQFTGGGALHGSFDARLADTQDGGVPDGGETDAGTDAGL